MHNNKVNPEFCYDIKYGNTIFYAVPDESFNEYNNLYRTITIKHVCNNILTVITKTSCQKKIKVKNLIAGNSQTRIYGINHHCVLGNNKNMIYSHYALIDIKYIKMIGHNGDKKIYYLNCPDFTIIKHFNNRKYLLKYDGQVFKQYNEEVKKIDGKYVKITETIITEFGFMSFITTIKNMVTGDTENIKYKRVPTDLYTSFDEVTESEVTQNNELILISNKQKRKKTAQFVYKFAHCSVGNCIIKLKLL